MPISAGHDRPTVFIRREAFERVGLERQSIDAQFNLTDQEFKLEGGLIAVGPLPSDDMLGELVIELETVGLHYFEDFFELSGNWPEWLNMFVASA
ncbi:MAG: hypothetical protein M3R65_02550 [Gemmatimonadota bacterium]|nr:hypothetical protein [Gemmatimonadota bacterium]